MQRSFPPVHRHVITCISLVIQADILCSSYYFFFTADLVGSAGSADDNEAIEWRFTPSLVTFNKSTRSWLMGPVSREMQLVPAGVAGLPDQVSLRERSPPALRYIRPPWRPSWEACSGHRYPGDIFSPTSSLVGGAAICLEVARRPG